MNLNDPRVEMNDIVLNTHLAAEFNSLTSEDWKRGRATLRAKGLMYVTTLCVRLIRRLHS